jgi:DNA-binding response OmpR family regulator
MAHILIVDNEPNIRFLLSIALSSQHQVLEAECGKDAIALFEEHKPAIVITDLNMPEMSGRELTRQLRSRRADVKIIATSALFDYPEECRLMIEAGANICLSKPIAIATLVKAVGDLLNS